MRTPSLVKSSLAWVPGVAVELDASLLTRLLQAVPRAPVWAGSAGMVALGLFFRFYQLDGYVTFYPDTYAQLRAVQNLVSGHLPISYFYPPGVAIFMAPAFLILPDTLLTLQAVIMVAGLALIVLAYVVCSATTGDRRAALLYAAAVSAGVTFVFHSRIALFEVINTLLIALSLFLAPWAARRGFRTLLPYALLVFAMVTVRLTNVIVLPALFLASLDLGVRDLSRRLVLERLRSKATLTVGLVVLALYTAYVGTAYSSLTRFANPHAESVVRLEGYPVRVGQYLAASLLGYEGEFAWPDLAAAGGVLLLAVVGAHRLWQTNRALLLPLAYLIVSWWLVHALYFAFWSRYAMASFFLVLMLAALGLSVCLEHWRSLRFAWQRVGAAFLLTTALTLFVGGQIAQDIVVLRDVRDSPARNAEANYEDIRAFLRGLEGSSSVLLSSQALAVDHADLSMITYDLVRHSETHGINAGSIDRLLAYVREQQAKGKTVYYHYTGYEEKGSRLHKHQLGFDAYFQAVQQEFSLRELTQAELGPQRLYVIEPPSTPQ